MREQANKQMRVAVTGAHGMLGTHIRAYLRAFENVEVVAIGRKEYPDLATHLTGCDAVVHLAGMNRGDEAEIARTNVALTEQLIDVLETFGLQPHVVFSSSTHINRKTPYGQSKREAAQLLAEWAVRSGGKFTNAVLPGVFGEGGKPFYNSVVATFCYQLANDEEPTANADTLIEQVHAQDVARRFWQILQEGEEGTVRVQGDKMTVFDLLETLRKIKELYTNHIIPDLSTGIQRDLFNMYHSYLYPRHYPVALMLHTDPRGSLFEAIKCLSGGQTFMSTTHPSVTRGNHFHTRKVERFLVTEGEAEIKLRHIFSRDIQTFRVSGKQPSYIDIPTLHTHNITNVGEGTLHTLFWTNELFDPENPDQVLEMVD